MIFKSVRSSKGLDPEREAFRKEALTHMESLYNAALYMARS